MTQESKKQPEVKEKDPAQDSATRLTESDHLLNSWENTGFIPVFFYLQG